MDPSSNVTRQRVAYASRPEVVSAIFATLLWLGVMSIGASSGLTLPVVPRDTQYQPWSQVFPIFLNNATAAISIYSGVLLLGSISIVQTIILGLFSGAAIHAAVVSLGFNGAVDLLVPYFIFEALGLIAATWAGLLPVTTAAMVPVVNQSLKHRWKTRVTNYLDAMRRTIPLLFSSLVLLLIGAVLEVAGGLPR